jgi:hypothetical protein
MGSDTAHTPSFNTDLPVPVSFRSFDISNGFIEYATSLVSLFHDGLVITSPKKLRQGSLLSIRMRMPPERRSGDFCYCRCTVRIIAEQRVHGSEPGYEVEFEPLLPA